MKKIMTIVLMLAILLTSGCQRVSDLMKPPVTNQPETVLPQITQQPEAMNGTDENGEPKTKIPLSQMLEMTNDWTILGSFNFEITKKGKVDRIVLGTSAKAKNGEMMWDDSQYWTVAVISEDGAYNLYSERIQGNVYVEMNEAYLDGVVTPVITVYIFSSSDRQIRNYVFDGEFFVENIEFTTKSFSTGGINTRYGTWPEYKPL